MLKIFVSSQTDTVNNLIIKYQHRYNDPILVSVVVLSPSLAKIRESKGNNRFFYDS